MMDNNAIESLKQDFLARFLAGCLERAYQEGGNDAVLEKLETYGLSSSEYTERLAAQTLARLWVEGREERGG